MLISKFDTDYVASWLCGSVADVASTVFVVMALNVSLTWAFDGQ